MKTEERLDVPKEKIRAAKKPNFFKRFTKKLRIIFKLLGIILVFVIGIMIGNHSLFESESPMVDNSIINATPDVDVTYLNTALKEASELTTAKLRINGLVDFKDTGVVILNKADFIMKYTADISAGIDMSKVEIKKEDVDDVNKKITVKIPKATVFKPNVYHGKENIKFYNEKFALFNINEKDDLSVALTEAEKDAKDEAVKNGLLELADKQSATLIKGILSDAVAPTGYAIEIQYIENE